jgi:membrane protein YdbS with pleckstrin-like domain
MREPPRHHLDPRARTLWQLSGAIFTGIVLLAAAGVAWVLLSLTGASPVAVIGIGALVVVLSALWIWPIPQIEWRHWRYEIGEQEVDLQHGWLVVTRTLVPMVQIQHVDSRRGPLERRFGLSTVVLYTAAGANEIPALDDAVAGDVQARIASLANLNQQL